ncbi:MAG: LptF/LptG family permease, partial [Planctomycetota bacterium]|nr:LptF/LptG family permease [Planctomycetota bacterium]
MAIYDRYLAVLFFRVLLVIFTALCGLFMIVDFFERLEEFLDITKTEGTLAGVAFEFYTPRVLSFFDRISGLVALISAVFVVTWIRTKRELVAIYAGGIHLRRIIRPILVCVVIIAGFGIINREILIPSYKERLIRDTRNWFGKDEVVLRPTFDRMTGFFLNGKSCVIADNEILSPNIQLPPGISAPFERIVAAKGKYLLAEGSRPAGYLFTDVS